MIELKDVTKIFKAGDGELKAVNGVSLKIDDGEFVSIVGRSGSGKSTLMHMMGGLDVPTSGEIVVGGDAITSMDSAALSDYRLKRTGFVFQAFHLEPEYTVYDNVRMPLVIAGVPFKEHKNRVREALKKVGIEEKFGVKTAKLSGGEKQRTAIARALINDPGIIFADEPCGNLDTANSGAVMDLLRKLNEDGKTVVLVTHNMSDAAKTKRVIELRDGVVVRDEKNSIPLS